MIRPTVLADLEAICRIERDTFTMPWSENAFLSALRDGNYVYLTAVAEDTQEVIGYCSYLRSFETADITNMAVHSDFRGKGVGKALLTALMDKGYALGIERFTLEVRAGNTPAIHLYESLGFRTEGIRKNFYALPTEDAWIMWTPEVLKTMETKSEEAEKIMEITEGKNNA